MPPYVNGRVPSASPYSRDAVDFWQSRGVNTLPMVEASERRQRNSRLVNRIATGVVGGLAGGSLLGGFSGGGTTPIPGYTPGWEGNTALLFNGGGMNLGRLLGSRGFETGLNAITSIFGNRAANRANRYAADANSRLMADQIALERERIRRQEEADALDRAEAQRRWEAEERWRATQFAASEEERAYARRLSEEREGRRAAYRPYRDAAMRSLGAILRIG